MIVQIARLDIFAKEAPQFNALKEATAHPVLPVQHFVLK